MRRLSRLLALALLAWLPLQAAALPALVLACELDPGHSPMHHAQHDANHGDHHGEHNNDGADGHDGAVGHGASGHGCCHHYSTAAPTLAIGVPEATAEVVVTASIHLRDFFPEQPKRPPLASL